MRATQYVAKYLSGDTGVVYRQQYGAQESCHRKPLRLNGLERQMNSRTKSAARLWGAVREFL